MLFKFTEKMPGKWGYPPTHTSDPRKYVSKCVLQDGLSVDGLPGSQLSDREKNRKIMQKYKHAL